jgi:hypothetical protein
MTRRYRATLVPLAAFALLVTLAAPVRAAGGVGDAFVTSDAADVVRAYAGLTGNYLGIHSTGVLGDGQLAIHFGLTNGRVLVGSFGGGVDEYVAATGAYIKTYATTGGWQWAGLYGPNGNVYIGSFATGDIREYDVNTGALVGVLYLIPDPADMNIGPNGNLYIAQYQTGAVTEIDFAGNFVSQWFQPPNSRSQDVEFLPGGGFVVPVMGNNVAYRYNAAHALTGIYVGTGWQRPHGVDLNPADGLLYIVDGVTMQVHVFDPVSMAELNPAWLSPGPGDKIVDIEFRQDQQIVPVVPRTWSQIKQLGQ